MKVPTAEIRFGGRIGRTVAESTPWWPSQDDDGLSERRPNVVIILLDDVGFGQLSCYGSDIQTPNIDALSADGIRYTNFHVTPMCSPTRACLLTGRNHHSVGMGYLADFDTGYPAYRGRITTRAETLAEMLSVAGYGTYAAGKWHLAPPGQLTKAGPFTHWPTGRGFDRWYGFLGGEDDQWHPELWEDRHFVADEKYGGGHLSEMLVDRSCGYLSDHISGTPERPFFLYLAFGACHAPHQAPASHINAYHGRFRCGWDVARRRILQRQRAMGIVPPMTSLADRNPDVPAWDDLSSDEKAQCERLQEAFAGFMSHTDEQVGRLLRFLVDHDVNDRTMIVLLSDNGASGEGGRIGSVNEYRYFLGLPGDDVVDVAALERVGTEDAHNHYPSGWAQAGNTPMKYYKKHTFGGGVRVPCIIRPPGGDNDIAGLRGQFHHVIDIAPTILDFTGVDLKAQVDGTSQWPLHGMSMRYTIDSPDAASTHTQQYFEMGGQRGIYRDGWKAVTMHTVGNDYESDRWELYRVDEDTSETNDLAAYYPDLVTELEADWWDAADRYGVLPLDDRAQARAYGGPPEAERAKDHRMYPGSRVMSSSVINFGSRPFELEAVLDEATQAMQGVILAHGRRASGFCLYVDDRELRFDCNLAGDHTIVATRLAKVRESLGVRVIADEPSGAVAELIIDGTVREVGRVPRLFPAGFGTLSTQCGYNAPSSVSADYEPPFRFTGGLRHVDIRLGRRLSEDVDGVTAALRQQ